MPTLGSRRRAAWLLLALTAALAPGAAAAAPPASPPALLASPAAHPQDPDVAVNDAGRAVAVWVERTPVGDMVTSRSRIAPGGPWSPTERLGTLGAPPIDPVVAIDDAGAAVVVWRETGGPVRSAVRAGPSAPWTAVTVDPAPGGFTSPAVAMGPAGAVVAWAQPTADGWLARRAVLTAGSWRLDPPLDLAAAGVVASADAPAQPAMAVSRRGDAAAVWPGAAVSADAERTVPVAVALRPAGTAGWAAASRLSSAGRQAAVALGDDGTAAAIWLEDGAVAAAVRASSAAAWPAAQQLLPAEEGAPAGGGPAFPAVALNGEGYALAAWAYVRPVSLGLSIQARRRSGASGLWAPATTVASRMETDAVLELRHIEALVDAHRTGYLAWLDPEGPGSATVHAATSAGGAWEDAPLQVREDLQGFALAAAVHGGAVLLAQRARIEDPAVELVAAGFHEPGAVALSADQLLISQRISQAAVRRSNAALARLDGGLTGGDVRDESLLPTDFGPGVRIEGVPVPPPVPVGPVSPLAIPPPAPGAGIVRLTRQQLIINQRISQEAVRRSNAGRARIDAGLTGADVLNGALTARKLAPGLRVVAAVPGPPPPAPAAAAPAAAPAPRPVTLSRSQLLINQRIAQAAVLRANWLVEKLEGGITGAEIRDGGLTAEDLAPELHTG
jgi:hypothetical protein